MVLVTRLAPGQWPTLRRARLRALEDAPYAFGSTWEEESDRPDEWWMTSTDSLVWFVAEEAGEPVGLAAGLTPGITGGSPEVISMWVDAAHRGSGVADALLGALFEWAGGQGAGALALNVAEDNDRARRFYQKAGFLPTGRRQPLASRPAVSTMELSITLHPEAGHAATPEDRLL